MKFRFATTRWSVVLEARDGEGVRARLALEFLCEAYWYPLYAYTRRRGYDAQRAQDLTQAFFADLLERDTLRAVDPEKGRFRSFLLASTRNFLAHDRDRRQALKRGGGVSTVSINQEEAEERFSVEPATELDPEQLFERRWGLLLMERAMDRLRSQLEDGGRSGLFQALQPFLTGTTQTSYREVAEELSMSVGAVKVAVHRLRRRYGELLRQEISQTVVDGTQVDDELRYLLTQIRPWQAPSRS